MATLIGDLGENTIIGGTENDYIEGKEANDWLEGKEGFDTYKYNLGDGYDIIADSDKQGKLLFGEGITRDNLLFIKDNNDLVIKVNHCKGKVTFKDAFLFDIKDHAGYIMFADGSILTAPEIENLICATQLIYGSDEPETIYGTAQNDYIDSLDGKDKVYGGLGNDIIHTCKKDDYLDGGPGKDFLQGCAGNDTYIVDNFGDIVDEWPGWDIDTVYSYVDHTLADNVENLYLMASARKAMGNSSNNNIYGNEQDNFLHGNEGDDVIHAKDGNDTIIGCYGDDEMHGGKGADSMIGYDGDDLYVVDNFGDKVVEAVGGGNDTVYASVDHKLADNVENLTLKDTAITAIGNSQNNLIYGNDQNNYVNAGAGNDKIYDYVGDDTIRGCRGDDEIYDYGGSDVFEICACAGKDTIYNEDKSTGDYDVIRLVGNINKDQIAFCENDSDLMIRYNRGHEVVVKDYKNPAKRIERLELAKDGSYLTPSDVNSIVNDLSAYQADAGVQFDNAEQVAHNPDAMNMIAAYWN